MPKRATTPAMPEADIELLLATTVIAYPDGMTRKEIIRSLAIGMSVAQTLVHVVDRTDDRSNGQGFRSHPPE